MRRSATRKVLLELAFPFFLALASVTASHMALAAEIPTTVEIHALLDTPLSSRTSRVGDRFTATVSQPVRETAGATLVPAGSKLMGEIADAGSAPTHLRNGLTARFDEIVLPSGQRVPIQSLVSLGAGAKDINLPAQTPLTLHLDRPAVVPTY